MESLESMLREEFDQPSYRPGRSVSELVGNTRRLRRRRTVAVTSAALGVILAAALGVVLVQQNLDRPLPPAHPVPSVVDDSEMDEFGIGLARTGIPWAGGFLDPDHGYLLLARCPDRAILDCTARLLVTADGGAHFTERATPSIGDFMRGAELRVFDGGALVFDALLDNARGEPQTIRRWASPDGGLNWREVASTPTGTVAVIPVGGKLVGALPIPDGQGDPSVLMPDGTSYTLSSIPTGATVVPSFWAGQSTYDGSHFLWTSDDVLLVSTDRGVTWQPSDTGGRNGLSIIGGNGEYVYGVLRDDIKGTPSQPPNLFVSENRGRTWRTVPWPVLTPIVGHTPGQYGKTYTETTSVAVLPSGGLLLSDFARLWRLPLGGDAFEPVGTERTLAVLAVGGMALGIRGDIKESAYYLTTDGDNWRLVDLS